MITRKIDPIIRLTAFELDLPDEVVAHVVKHQFAQVRKAIGEMLAPRIYLRRLGSFQVKLASLDNRISKLESYDDLDEFQQRQLQQYKEKRDMVYNYAASRRKPQKGKHLRKKVIEHIKAGNIPENTKYDLNTEEKIKQTNGSNAN